MVSYYNSLAMFPNRHAPQSSSPAAAAAAAAAAYLGYHGYHHTHHPHHHHHHASHHHVHPQASPPTAPPATHHQSHHLHHNIGHHLPHHQYTVENHDIGGNGGVHAMGGTGMNHLSGHQHHQYAPPTPPSQYDHSPHHHIPHHLLQQHAHSEGEGQSPQPLGAAAAASVAWHSPVYSASSCTRGPESAPGMTGGVYEGWSPQPPMQPTMGSSVAAAAQQGSPPPPSSVTPDYKLAPGLDFSMSGSPAMVGMASQQPQDLSNGSTPSAVPMGGVSLPLLPAASLPAHHASPDSGLAGSSDGVSSSAGSPQHMHHLQHSHVHSQMGQQGMQMAMQPSQQVLLQAAADEMRQHPQQQSQHQPQGDQHQQQQPRPQPVRSPYEWMKKPSYQSQPNPGKTRTKDKYRVVYSDRQRLELEKEFHYSRYITIRRKSELATALGLSDRQVKIWFQNRRAKERKHLKKREEVAHKDKVEGGDGSQQQQRDQITDQMPPDLIPNQLHIGAHTLHHAQHLHHHHSHQHHADLTEAPSQQQQQPPMVLPLSSVTIGGVDL